MIPIGDSPRARNFPIVTYSLILLNVLFFLVELMQGDNLNQFILDWGAVPNEVVNWQSNPNELLTLVTSMFLHGGWLHLIGNMLYLTVFGDNIEDRMGAGNFIFFYLSGGILAGLAQVWVDPNSPIPAIGASGAVAAVLGAYLVLYPTATVQVVVPLFYIFPVFAVPAVFVLGFWFISQFFNGVLALSAINASYEGGVAWWAHIGGFVVGVVVGLMVYFERKK